MGDEKNEVIAVHSYRMEYLEKQMAELCTKISVLIETLPERYQTKEMCANMTNGCKQRNDEKYDDLEEKYDKLSDKYDKLLWSFLGTAGVVIWDLAKPLLMK